MTMRVDGIPQRNLTLDSGSGVPAPRSGTGGFATLLQADARPAAAVEGGATPLAGLSAVQAEVNEIFARQQQDLEARRHGRAMLKALGAVQVALLGGDDARAHDALRKLAATAQEARAGDDPVLRLVLREIGVRAAVELSRNAPKVA